MRWLIVLVLTVTLCLAPAAHGDTALDNALSNAAAKGDLAEVQAFLAKGAEINAKEDKYGYTALRFAAGKGHLSVVQALLAKGADVNAKDKDGWTALMSAANGGYLEIVQALLAKGADGNGKNNHGYTALMFAALKGHLSVVQALLAKGADVNAKDKGGNTALKRAAYEGHLSVVQALLAKGADVNAKDKGGNTALMLEALRGHLPMVQALLAKSADVNAKNDNGETALILAARNGYLPVVQALLAKGADVSTKDSYTNTALTWAAQYGHQQIVQALQAVDQQSPAARKAFDESLVAVKQQDWQTTMRQLLKAKEMAPAAPEVLFNLGLAESKVPGRELRAICWFRAYLAKAPNAANADAVRKEITGLESQVKATIEKLISQAKQLMAKLSEDQVRRNNWYLRIAVAQAAAGDIAGARNLATAKAPDKFLEYNRVLAQIAAIQYHDRDVAGAENTIREIGDGDYINQSSAYRYISYLQAIKGDFTGAEKTIEKSRYAQDKRDLYMHIAMEEALAGKRDRALSHVAKALNNQGTGGEYNAVIIQAFFGDIETAKRTYAAVNYDSKYPLNLLLNQATRQAIEIGAETNRKQLDFICDPKLLTVKTDKPKPSENYVEWTRLLREKLGDELYTDQQSAIRKIAANEKPDQIVGYLLRAIQEITTRFNEIKSLNR